MEQCGILIIGSGPGGYVAAIRAAQNGQNVVLVEKSDLGGICLNWGCIPTKALLHSAETVHALRQGSSCGIKAESLQIDTAQVHAYSRSVAEANRTGVEFLMKKNKVRVIKGLAVLQGYQADGLPVVHIESSEGYLQFCAQHIILATGASPRELPLAKPDGVRILNYKQAMGLNQFPKSILTLGSGAIGTELSWFFHEMGVQVTLVEMLPQILPQEDADIARHLNQSFTKQGIRCLSNTKVTSISTQIDHVLVSLENSKGESETIQVDTVLTAIGMVPNTQGLGIESVGVQLDERGFIQVNDFMQTTAPRIYAIGDCTGKQMLAHKASAEAECAIDHLCHNEQRSVNYNQIPACIYSHPQIASVGLSEAQAKAKGVEVQVGRFPFQASGKARAQGRTEGFVKLVFDRNSGMLVGANIIGGEAPEMIASLALALSQKLTWAQIGHVVFPHPSLSEAIAEAALASQRKAVHI